MMAIKNLYLPVESQVKKITGYDHLIENPPRFRADGCLVYIGFQGDIVIRCVYQSAHARQGKD